MKANILQTLFLLFAATVLTAASCRNGGTEPDAKVPENLVKQFTNGEISSCTLDGDNVYHCRLNANDAGSEIYNTNGDKVATCNAAWGQQPDPECSRLENCDVLYRIENNIWGLAPVNNLDGGGGQ